MKPWERSAVVRPEARARPPVVEPYDPDPDTRSGFGDVRRALADELAREADGVLLTRGSFEKLLDAVLVRARERRSPIGLVALRFEDWKPLADRAGEDALVRALGEIARELRRRARSSDELGRIAQAEIALILPGCEEPALAVVATRIRLAVEGREVALAGARVRLSALAVEIAACPRNGNPGAAPLIAELEQALELARVSGGR